jgi:uncharacterized OsmC-like protein
MTSESKMMSFKLEAARTDSTGSVLSAKETELVIDTSLAGRMDALNPVELLLAALAACILKGIERVAPTLEFTFSKAEVSLVAHRPEHQARIADVSYVIRVGTDETDGRLELLHKNLQKFGTIFNTLKHGTELSGRIERL